MTLTTFTRIRLFLANLLAFFLEFMPNPLLTKDQIKLLKYDNIETGNFKTNFDLNMPSKLYLGFVFFR